MSSERVFSFFFGQERKGDQGTIFSNLLEITIVVPWLFWHKLCYFFRNRKFQSFIFFREFFCVKENE